MKRLKDANEALGVIKNGGKLYYMSSGSYIEAGDKNPFNSPDIIDFYRIYTESEACEDMFKHIKAEKMEEIAYTGGGCYTDREWFQQGWDACLEYVEKHGKRQS